MKDAQVGFNTNVVYHGTTLHIQTEDSGLGRPHVITHLYREGTILATRRASYDPLGEPAEVRERVRALMKAQHKQVILDLRDGEFDEVVDRALAGVPPAAGDAGVGGELEGERAVGGAPAAPAAGSASAAEAAHPALTPPGGRGRSSYRPPAPGPAEPDRVRPDGADSGAAAARPRRATPLRPSSHREREGFGKELISDRSLDEVVLSYLAEELTKDEK
jgi:hypothetical protein